MPDPRNIIMAALIGLAIGLLTGWYFTGKYKDGVWQSAIDKQKAEVAGELQAATERAIAAERKNNEISDQLEVQHAQNQAKLDDVLADNRRLAREFGGLRDPGRRPGCSGSVPTSPEAPGSSSDGPTGSELSAKATEFLLEFARSADQAAQYANTCHEWIKQVK